MFKRRINPDACEFESLFGFVLEGGFEGAHWSFVRGCLTLEHCAAVAAGTFSACIPDTALSTAAAATAISTIGATGTAAAAATAAAATAATTLATSAIAFITAVALSAISLSPPSLCCGTGHRG